MSNAAASLSGITKRYSRRGRWVLRGIDLELEPGSRTVVVGGNGSGKSSLLRIGAGVSRPNNGALELPHRIGYVPERLSVPLRCTGAEYLQHMARIKGLRAGMANTRSRQLLERLHLQPSAYDPMGSLSKGNRQKLVLAQAFLAPVGLLVLDEPFGGLDAVAHVTLEELISEAQSAGTAVLLSGHRSLPDGLGTHQLKIVEGRLCRIGHADADLAQANVRAMEVRVSSTDAGSDRQRLAAIAGVRRARSESAGSMVLLTDGLRVDGVLLEAIAQGWSVRSVREVPGEDGLDREGGPG